MVAQGDAPGLEVPVEFRRLLSRHGGDLHGILNATALVLRISGVHGLDVQPHHFPVGAIVVATQRLDRVNGAAQVLHPEALVLTVPATVLAVEMRQTRLAEFRGEGHPAGRI